MDSPSPCQAADPGGFEPRRAFVSRLTAWVLGGVAYVTPLVAGVVSFLHPVRASGGAGRWFRLATLDTLPPDGTPRKFPVVADRVDAWTRSREAIGAVFLLRTGPKEVKAFQVICPHAGCPVDYVESIDPKTQQPVKRFFCACHKASFDLSGNRTDPTSPSPRPLDELATRVEGDDIWVEFLNFQTGIASKVPLA